MIIRWNGNNWENQIGDSTIIHPTATGLYPPKTGWPNDMVFNYNCNWIDDDGNVISRNYENFLKSVNLTGNETIKFNTNCTVDETVLLPQETISALTYNEYQELNSYASLEVGNCGIGSLTPLLDDSGSPIYDANNELIFTQPVPITDGLITGFKLIDNKQSFTASATYYEGETYGDLIAHAAWKSPSTRMFCNKFDGTNFINYPCSLMPSPSHFSLKFDDTGDAHVGAHSGSSVRILHYSNNGMELSFDCDLPLSNCSYSPVRIDTLANTNDIVVLCADDCSIHWVRWNGSVYSLIDMFDRSSNTGSFIEYDPYTETIACINKISSVFHLEIFKFNNLTNKIDLLTTIELGSIGVVSTLSYDNGEIILATKDDLKIHKFVYNPDTTSVSLEYESTYASDNTITYCRSVNKLNDTQYFLSCYGGSGWTGDAFLITDTGSSLIVERMVNMAAEFETYQCNYTEVMTPDTLNTPYIIVGTMEGKILAYKPIYNGE